MTDNFIQSSPNQYCRTNSAYHYLFLFSLRDDYFCLFVFGLLYFSMDKQKLKIFNDM